MRAFVLWQVSRGYRRVDSTKAEATLRRAFLTTLSIEDRSPSDQYCGSDFCYVRGRLQGPILEKLGEHSLPQIEKFLPSAEPEVRRRFTLRLIKKYISGKHFDHAMDLFDQVADDYPYEQANQLLALPAERAGDRLAIFTQALRHFDQDHRRSWTVGSDDLGTMIVRFWRQLPVPSVLDAVDKLLREAKPRGTTDGMQFTMSSGSNDVSFGSTYEYRLFQLLPVLRELEPMHAEDLLRENPKLRDDLQRLPDGMQSLSATYSDTPPAEGEGSEKPETSFPMLGSPAQIAAHAAFEQLQTRIQEQMVSVLNEADPKQALADALTLPVSGALSNDWELSPRASVLSSIAKATVKSEPAVARPALAELLKLGDKTTRFTQVQLIGDVPNIYLELGDQQGTRDAVRDLLKLADGLYARDTNSDDPNLAFKWRWPSTAMWRRCVQAAAQVAPDFAQTVIAEITDPEIATFEKVYYANSLVGVEQPSMTPMDIVNKQGMGGTGSE